MPDKGNGTALPLFDGPPLDMNGCHGFLIIERLKIVFRKEFPLQKGPGPPRLGRPKGVDESTVMVVEFSFGQFPEAEVICLDLQIMKRFCFHAFRITHRIPAP